MGLDERVADVKHLTAVIERGLPKQALLSVLAYFPEHGPVSRNRLLRRVVSLSTFRDRKLLKPEEGEKVVRLARLIAFARLAWGDDDHAAREFFLTPHPLLERQRPLDLAFSELGAIRVERLLTNVLIGLPA